MDWSEWRSAWGAAKLTEQIGERIESGRREILQARVTDPIIEKLKALPVNRQIEPEEKNVRRTLSKKRAPKSGKQRRRQWSKEISQLWTEGATLPVIRKRMEAMAAEIDLLRLLVKKQKAILDRQKPKRRS